MDMKKIVVASDSFKGSLESIQVAEAAERGIRKIYPGCEVLKVNVADGGEGTVRALVESLGGKMVHVMVPGPLDDLVSAEYGLAGDTAIIEMASASGLTLIPEERRNPLVTSTYGTGVMICDAIGRGARKFLVGIGGSATNDGGTGMLRALGYRFNDSKGNELEGCGANLEKIATIDMDGVLTELKECSFTVACDVDTPFCGPKGAAHVFARQKGASEADVLRLDAGMKHFAEVVKQHFGTDISDMEGAGAAGGLGGGFKAFLGAALERGIDMVLDAIDFDSKIKGADLIFTGEGRIDFQTPKGKTACGVLARAKKQDIPTIALGGCVADCPELEGMGFAGIFPVIHAAVPLETAMDPQTASANVERTVREILRLISRTR